VNAYALAYNEDSWAIFYSLRRATIMARRHSVDTIYRRTVKGAYPDREGWDYPTWVTCSTPIKIESTSWRVQVHYPGGETVIEDAGLTWNAAQHAARGICREYSYSNAGARCLRLDPRTWMLGWPMTGPRATVKIVREEIGS
jgi:hypothetical protein